MHVAFQKKRKNFLKDVFLLGHSNIILAGCRGFPLKGFGLLVDEIITLLAVLRLVNRVVDLMMKHMVNFCCNLT